MHFGKIFLPIWCQAIISTNGGFFLLDPWKQISVNIEIRQQFPCKQMNMEKSFAIWHIFLSTSMQ